MEQQPLDLAAVQKTCDRALEDARKWKRRYEIEAQQRRTEAEMAERTIRDLRAELLQLCQLGPGIQPAIPLKSGSGTNESIHRLEQLTLEVVQLRQEHDQLAEALRQEQQQHAKTRENLITALGEALQRGKASR